MFRKRMQLAMIHLGVAMALVPINSTLNRVMIKELALSATLVAILASLPYLFSPLQVLIGSYSDRHPLLGYRRTPYIAAGLLLCVLGVIISPRVVYLLPQNDALGLLLSALAFGAWGMGFNLASVSYLSLASEVSGEQGRSRTVSIMWFVMIVGIIVTAASLSHLLDEYSPVTLQHAFDVVGIAALVLGTLGLIGLEAPHPRDAEPAMPGEARQGWQALLRGVLGNPVARLFFFYLIILLAAILGQDVLLEPYAGEAFNMPVSMTTRITSIWGTCVLITLVLAGWLEQRIDKRNVARIGAWVGAAGFFLIAGSGLIHASAVFFSGVVLLGLGTGLSTVSNLSLMLDMTTARVGLYIGTWGLADALARLLGTVMSGVVRDVVASLSTSLWGYITVFTIEGGLLLVSLIMLARIDVTLFRGQSQMSLSERAALMNEAS